MQGKPLIMLALAGTLGLGAMFLTNRLLNKKPTAEAAMRDVLVAVRDFNAEEVIKPEMVKTIRMSESAIPVGAFAAAEDVSDRWVRTTMLEGEPIVERKLGPKGSPPGLVANIPKGMRAFAVEVNEQSGVSGFILPSHRVDVIKFETGDKGRTRGETILQDVLVLAAGQVFVKSDEKTLQSRTVTLAVTPDDVDLLVAAKAKGVLSLALRGVNDHDLVELGKCGELEKCLDRTTEELDQEKKLRAEQETALAQVRQELDQEKKLRADREEALAQSTEKLDQEKKLRTDGEAAVGQLKQAIDEERKLRAEKETVLAETMKELELLKERIDKANQIASLEGYIYRGPGNRGGQGQPESYRLRGERTKRVAGALSPSKTKTPGPRAASPAAPPESVKPPVDDGEPPSEDPSESESTATAPAWVAARQSGGSSRDRP